MKDKKIDITYTDGVLDYLINKWFDEQFGARPLKRAIQKYILDPLATQLIKWEIKEWDEIKFGIKDDKVDIIKK